jgi:hypothetical protein
MGAIMQSKLFVLAIVGPTILTFASQSSANILISYGYNGSNYTTNLDPQNLGFHMGGSVSLSFDSSVLTANDVTGAYTLSGGPNGIATFINVTSGGYIVASSQGPDAIDPLSFITFDHGLVTSWAIRGAYPYDTVPFGPNQPPSFMQSVSHTPNVFGQPVQDYITVLCGPGDSFPNASNLPCNSALAFVKGGTHANAEARSKAGEDATMAGICKICGQPTADTVFRPSTASAPAFGCTQSA